MKGEQKDRRTALGSNCPLKSERLTRLIVKCDRHLQLALQFRALDGEILKNTDTCASISGLIGAESVTLL